MIAFWLLIAAAAALALWGAADFFDILPDRAQAEEVSTPFFFAQLAAAFACFILPEDSGYATYSFLLWGLLFATYCMAANA